MGSDFKYVYFHRPVEHHQVMSECGLKIRNMNDRL